MPHVTLPNLRELFIPDDGYAIFDVDLERADAQVVIWESGDEDLKQKCREHFDLHTENAKDIYGVTTVSHQQRQNCKSGIHAVNYGVAARRLAEVLGCTVHEADQFIKRWFDAHPLIKDWQNNTYQYLQLTHMVYNAYGYRRYYFDRIDRNLLGKALAWKCQSVVAIATNKGLVNIENNVPDAQLLLQVHDSVVGQVPITLCPAIFDEVEAAMHVIVPFTDPLTIPCALAASNKSWGHCVPRDEYQLAA